MYDGHNFINGKFVKARDEGYFSKVSPVDLEVMGHFPNTSPEEVNDAVEAAVAAQKMWREFSRVVRAEFFDRLCEVVKKEASRLTSWISLETGKSLNEAHAEVIEALHMAQYTFGMGRMPNGYSVASEIAAKDSFLIRKPKGVVAVISPWNFPLAIGGFWCAAPAILEGNTVVYKPSEDTPICGQLTAELYFQAGFPPGVINVIHGNGEVGAKLVNHKAVKHICFTGSVSTGQYIKHVCADTMDKSCSCEMGSKSAVIYFGDGDLELGVSASINSAFKLSGQRCVSAGRILVERPFLPKFKDMFLEQVEHVAVCDPNNQPYEILTCGPLINASQYERVQNYNRMVRNDPHCKVLYDPDAKGLLQEKGYFLRPFVYQCEWMDKPFLKEEVFGPHVALIPFDSINHAIEIYNDTQYGLSLGVITNDFKKARMIRDNCDFGLGYWNGGSIAAESHLPFGGVKASGFGGSSAAGTFDAVVNKVTWTVNHGGLAFPQGLR
jgi:aldehyde dehydrogenase (NAD+)